MKLPIFFRNLYSDEPGKQVANVKRPRKHALICFKPDKCFHVVFMGNKWWKARCDSEPSTQRSIDLCLLNNTSLSSTAIHFPPRLVARSPFPRHLPNILIFYPVLLPKGGAIMFLLVFVYCSQIISWITEWILMNLSGSNSLVDIYICLSFWVNLIQYSRHSKVILASTKVVLTWSTLQILR